jgi:hypothetical protein
MVPMINAFKKSFSYQLDSLSQYLKENYHRGAPESGFAHYVFQQTNNHIPFDVANDIDIATLETNRLSEAPALAAVGYGLACGRQFSEGFLETWANGLVRLSGREAFPAHRASFFYRPTELLGIALGVSYHYESQPEQSKWLQDILVEGEQRATHSDLWTFLLSAYAAHILSVTWRARGLPLVHEMTVDELALAKWLCSVEPTFAHIFGLIQVESSIDKTLLEYCIEFSSSAQDSARAALLYFALKRTINQIFQSSWDEYEQIQQNPQKSIEWLRNICDKVHVVTQYLQSQLSRQSDVEAPNIHDMQLLLQALARLHSDTDIIKAEISKQIRMQSSLYVVNNECTLITGGYVTMTHNQDKSVTNQTKINAPNSSFGFVQSGSGTVSNFSQNIGSNIDHITRLIRSLREMAQEFPESERQEALVHLDDLQEDISTPEKQKPERIKIRLGRLLGIAGTIASVVVIAADFSNNVLELAEKLGVPIELSQPQPMQQLPPSAPNQPSERSNP